MSLPPFNSLPKSMQTPQTEKYYNLLSQNKIKLIFKRLFDLSFSMLLLVFCLPIMGAIALVVCLESPGGAVFRQKRVTTYGDIFTIFKFRTMYKNSGNPENMSGKVTAIGSLLRRSRLDELPQLVNIMIGEMSFVGARPEIPSFVKSYSPEMLSTLLLPAGVTSRASIKFKDEESILPQQNRDEYYIRHLLPIKMGYNLEYLESFSLWEDFKILLSTGFAVMRR